MIKITVKTSQTSFIHLSDDITVVSKCNIKVNTELTKFYEIIGVNITKANINPSVIILIAVLVVIVRGFMGYGIPTSWNKTVLQNVIFFCTMGLGKAFGGILSDLFGIRKVAIFSTLIAIPFLCFGDSIMIVSLIGVMFFSMTMAITLGILVSKLKQAPGLAFGITTIGLFLGTAPIFFIRLDMSLNIILIITASILCSVALGYVLKGDK